MHLQYLSTETQEKIFKSTSQAYGFAVAIAIAYAVPRPTAAVTNLEEELDKAKVAMKEMAGWFNEARPVNLTQVIDHAGAFWKSLYEVAHGNYLENMACALSPLDLFGVAMHLSPDCCKDLCENYEAIGQVLGACVKAARQMQINVQTEQTNA